MSREVRIVVDAMGGDFAPDVNVKGAVEALATTENLKVVLTGDRPTLEKQLKKLGSKESARLKIEHCSEVISMEDHAAGAIRKKKDSSINVGLEWLRDKKADAFISAGNSGAVMAGALFTLGRIADVERPAIVIKLPTAEGYVIILDVGANVDCKPSHLKQFAEMGSLFAECVESIPRPKIALLSNGSELHKGNELTRGTHELLTTEKNLNYIGYVEGFDLFRGTADVVVCDGFVGNVILKLSEGLADTCFQWFRKEVKKDLAGLVGAVLMRSILTKFKAKFDYQPYGAAPLLGVKGITLISHGGSTEVAIRNGILTAKRAVEQDFIEKIRARLERTSS